MKKLKLIVAEDLMYGKLMGDFLNLGHSDLDAEELTIEELKKQFPRLRKLIKKDTKISLEAECNCCGRWVKNKWIADKQCKRKRRFI